MRTTSGTACFVALLAGCTAPPPGGTQIGALREEPPPALPTDFKQLDLVAAVEDAVGIGAIATLASAWRGHVGVLERAPYGCPPIWIGAPPEDIVELNFDQDQLAQGLSWVADCTAQSGDHYQGFSYWETEVLPGGTTANRMLVADSVVTDSSGTVLYDFDGEATDSLENGDYTSSLVARTLYGSLVGLGSGLRGEMDATWRTNGELSFEGAVTVLDGFGPPDNRDPDPTVTPELLNLPGWEQGMPRFTSVRFDLTWSDDCNQEPHGFVGIRGNEGFWFDVYFLPKEYDDPDHFEAKAFPFEEIDNVECDGVGTVFARNISLKAEDEADANWSRELTPDFASIVTDLPTPSIDDFVLTIRQLPEETP